MTPQSRIDDQQLATLYWTEKSVSNPIKWAIFLSGAALLSYWYWDGLSLEGVVALLSYALQNLLFTLLFSRNGLSLASAKLSVLVSYVFDFVFVAYLIFGLGGTASQVAFLMYVILIFKAGLHYPVFHESLMVLPLAVAFYLFLLALHEGAQVFGDYTFRPRLFLLVGIPAVTLYTARLLEHRERDLWDLNRMLQKKTDELKRQTAELEAVIQGMRDGLLITDANLTVLNLNPVVRSILRLSPDAEAPFPLESNENGQALRDVVAEALSSEERTSKREICLPMPNDGEEERRTYQAVASYIAAENGNSDQVVVILRDVTEQMRLEDAKSNFLSIVSHELRTPLSSIKGFLNIILGGRAGSLTETQRDFLTTAKGQAEYLHAMINDVVEFSRIQVMRTTLDLELVSLHDITTAVCSRLMPLAADKTLTMENLVPASIPLVEGDQLRLEQVVANLVCNAIKFTPEGGTITLSAEEVGDEVICTVRDTGMGIPLDQQQKIFEPFYQVSKGAARLHGGMGLGLSICRHIMERHNGRLFVESVEGSGSAFHFALAKHTAFQEHPDLEMASLS